MFKDTRKALEKSITSWKRHVKAGGRDDNVLSCALCERFTDVDCTRDTEEICPVMKKTGIRHCHGTPFYRFGITLERAEKMLVFLKALRPKDV